jgi:hypothetical protein
MRAICRSVLSLVVLSVALTIQVKAAEKSGRLSGSVVNVSKDKSEITLRQGTQGTASRIVEFSSATNFTAGSTTNSKVATPASSNDVNVGNYLTCVGTWDGVKLSAKNCTVRPSKKP